MKSLTGPGAKFIKPEDYSKENDRRKEFFIDDVSPEPHAARKADLIKRFPELQKLMGPEPLTKYTVAGTVLLQVLAAYLVRDSSWLVFFAVAYVVGAIANQSLFLAIHELSHRLGSKSIVRNKLYMIMANLPIGIPFGMTFGPYHMEHHRYQGHDAVDADIPTYIEGWVVSHCANNYPMHCLMKALFLFFQLGFYAIRPLAVRPETYFTAAKDPWLAINGVIQFAFDVLIVQTLGWSALGYLLLSTFLAGSIHPIAGHFIAEHYIFDDPANETYSYYGPLNIFAYNVGYHNEHHDFPNIPWTRLPEVRRIAGAYYNTLPQVTSWWGVLVRFIFDDTVTPFNRMKRPHRTGADAASWDKLVLAPGSAEESAKPAAAAAKRSNKSKKA